MTKRSLLVGWDSVCWQYLEPLLEKGELPHLRGLIDGGCAGLLRSTIPPITPAAWSSIVTGKLPQKHGVYDWVSGETGHLKVARSSDVRGTPFWKRLNERGIRVGLVNIPLTYPVRPVDGFVVAGFGAPPSSRELTHPSHLLEELEAACGGYTPILSQGRVNEFRKAGAALPLYEAEKEIQAQQVQAALYGARKYNVDVLAINLMLFDHTNHRARDFDLVEMAMRDTDCHLGLLIDGFQPDDVMLFSDHGARRFEGLFLIGDWLSERGYLVRQRKEGQGKGELNYLLRRYLRNGFHLDGLPERALRAVLRRAVPHLPKGLGDVFWRDVQNRTPRAFDHYWIHPTAIDRDRSTVSRVLNTGTLYLNDDPPQPADAQTHDRVTCALAAALEGIYHPETQLPLFQRVLKRADVYGDEPSGCPPDLFLDNYHSPFALDAATPDINMQQRYPNLVWFSDNPDLPFTQYGGHSHEGVGVFKGASFGQARSLPAAHLVDLPATLLYTYRVPIPEDWDGRVLADGFAESRPVLTQPGDVAPHERHYGLDEEIDESVEAEVLQRLRQLGYVD